MILPRRTVHTESLVQAACVAAQHIEDKNTDIANTGT